MFYHAIETQSEVIGEILDYNVGLVNDISPKAEDVLELITRPPAKGENFSYILGKVDYIRVPLRGENEFNMKEIVEDYKSPDAVYRIPLQP